MDKKLKVLFLSQRFLFPMDTGGKIRTGKILEQLSKIFSLTVISNVESPKDDKYLENMQKLCDTFIPVPWVEVPRYTLRFWIKLMGQMFSRYPVSVLNDYSPQLVAAINKEIRNERYDLLICDFLQSTLNFKGLRGYPMILFQHNVESAIVKRHLCNSRDPFSKLFWWLQTKKMMYHEKYASQKFDGVIAVSEKDKETFELWFGLHNVYDIPTGVDTDYFQIKEDVIEKPNLVFTGSMDWLPNEDAIIYFSSEIFPAIKQKVPQAKAVIVGRNPSPKILKLLQDNPEVTLTGWVEDTRPYISESSVFIVPIRVGGGTRMKIYEAMAMGKAMVATSIGAEGLPVRDGENILIADDAGSFAVACIRLMQNAEERKRLGKSAREFVYENYRWEIIARVFADICISVVEKNPKSAAK